MTEVEQRTVISETLYDELLERFDTNIEYYIENIEDVQDTLEELDEMHLYDYVEDLVMNKIELLIDRYKLVVVDGILNTELITPIYVDYIKKHVNGTLPFREI